MSFSSILIGIGGGTGSGKTSIANKLLEEYGEGDVVVIEQDAYYRDISHISLKDRHLHNFDHPDAIDIGRIHASERRASCGSGRRKQDRIDSTSSGLFRGRCRSRVREVGPPHFATKEGNGHTL